MPGANDILAGRAAVEIVAKDLTRKGLAGAERRLHYFRKKIAERRAAVEKQVADSPHDSDAQARETEQRRHETALAADAREERDAARRESRLERDGDLQRRAQARIAKEIEAHKAAINEQARQAEEFAARRVALAKQIDAAESTADRNRRARAKQQATDAAAAQKAFEKNIALEEKRLRLQSARAVDRRTQEDAGKIRQRQDAERQNAENRLALLKRIDARERADDASRKARLKTMAAATRQAQSEVAAAYQASIAKRKRLEAQLEKWQQQAHDRLIRRQLQGTRGGRAAAGNLRELDKAARATRNSTMQLSYAAQDFATVLAAGGNLSFAINSMSNNLGTLATLKYPVIGAVVGIATAIGGSLLQSALDASDGMSRLERESRNLLDTLDRMKVGAEAMAKQLDAVYKSRDTKTFDDAKEQIKQLDREREKLSQEGAALRARTDKIKEVYGITHVDELTGKQLNALPRDRLEDKILEWGDWILGIDREPKNNLDKFAKLDKDAQQRVVDELIEIQQELRRIGEETQRNQIESLGLESRKRQLESEGAVEAPLPRKRRSKFDRITAVAAGEGTRNPEAPESVKKFAEAIAEDVKPASEKFADYMKKLGDAIRFGELTTEQATEAARRYYKQIGGQLAPGVNLRANTGVTLRSEAGLNAVAEVFRHAAGVNKGRSPEEEMNEKLGSIVEHSKNGAQSTQGLLEEFKKLGLNIQEVR